MIEKKLVEGKMQALNEKISKINSQYGQNITDELLSRIEISINSFFSEFKELSSKSFENYWKNIELIKSNKLKSDDSIEEKKDESNGLNVPKFVRDYKNK